MDNRRVIRSYRDKTRSVSAPFQISTRKSSLMSKLKLYLTPSEGDVSKTSQQSFNQESEDNPNKMLSSFFLEKGDEPLNEVEIEGVKLLLARAKSTESNSKLLDSRSNDIPNSSTSSVVYKPRNTTFGDQTPSQTVLKNDSGVFSTPDYKPMYHTISDTKNLPSVKRVYQFSGLPSPYRTRIKLPALSKPKQQKLSPNVSLPSTLNPPASKQSMSSTATKLLSILDGDLSSKADVKKFVNPYAGQPNIKKRKPATAEDISRTVSFHHNEQSLSSGLFDIEDKGSLNTKVEAVFSKSNAADAEKKVQPETSEKFDDVEKEHITKKQKANGTASVEASSFRSSIPSKSPFNFSAPTQAEKPKLKEPTSAFKSSAPSQEKSANPTPAFSFPQAAQQKDSVKEATKATPAFPSSTFTSIATTQKPAFLPSSNGHTKFAFEFPTIQTTAVSLDPAKVERYKSLFHF